MAKPNYDFVRRQKEMAKKQKKEEKRLRKAAGNETPQEETQEGATPSAPAAEDEKPAG